MSVDICKWEVDCKGGEKGDCLITSNTLIVALAKHPYPIVTNVAIRTPVKFIPVMDDAEMSIPSIDIRSLDVKEYVIKAFRVMEDEIVNERNRANEILKEFNMYKDKHEEYKNFIKFKEAEDRRMRFR